MKPENKLYKSLQKTTEDFNNAVASSPIAHSILFILL